LLPPSVEVIVIKDNNPMSEASILVVDDEPDVRRMLQVILDRNGYEVQGVSSGLEALMAVNDGTPDLILLDIMMEGMDGWEVLKLLKMEERTRGIPVVILSARVEPRDKIRGLQEGAVDYITKPFSVKDVLESIHLILKPRAS
jgi:CheY-like chemotaxis protein